LYDYLQITLSGIPAGFLNQEDFLPTIQTSRLGEVTFIAADIIRFVKPILGFNEFSRYILISRPELEPFKWLQSVENADICFALVNPGLIVDNYSVEVTEHDIKLLEGAKAGGEYQFYVIATIPQGHPELISVNLQGPIVICENRSTALQMVLNNAEYQIKHNILKGINT
jgi:flagellar assembly factor FliW